MDKRERIVVIDLLKGLGILLMVAGHVGFSDRLNHYIYAFHMPLFFLMSGWVYRPVRGSFPAFAARQAKALLVPFAAFGLFFGMVFYALVRSTGLGHLLQNFLFPNSVPFDWCGAVWFLPCLFWIKVLYAAVERWVPGKFRWVVHALLCALGMGVSALQIKLPLTLDTCLMGYGIYWLGALGNGFLSQNREAVSRRQNLALVLCAIMLPLVFLNEPINMRENRYGNFLLFGVNLVSSMTLWAILLHKASEKVWFRRIRQGLQFLSDHSIAYMVFNQVLMVPFIVLVLRRLSPGPVYLAVQIGELVFVLMAAGIGSVIIKKTKLRVLLGSK